MASSVKDALRKHSDGSRWSASDINPPTPKDAKLRLKHVKDSVPYNTSHAYDHLEELCEQLKKLCAIDKPAASKLAKTARAKLEPMLKEIEGYNHGR
jgi:hypothetical protein